jgi:Protein of unknown function, DUF547
MPRRPDLLRRALRAWAPAVLLGAALAVLPALRPMPIAAAPKAEPWARWERHNEANRLHIDHGAWDEFLSRNLKVRAPAGINRLDYAHVGRVDRVILDAYLQQQAHLPISGYSRREQEPYWINLYNALTVRLVLAHWPVKSIRDIDVSPGLLADGPWGAKLITVEGEPLSLDDIEHRILRPLWHDPRLHYALNCASLGCPDLAPRAYTVFNLEEQLETGARDYVNSPRGAHFEGERLVVSSLYVWYEADFGGGAAGVLEHLRRYARGELAARLAGWQGGFADAYDWSINAP